MICSRCVLDDSVKDIVYDANGVCQFCHFYDKHLAEIKRDFTPQALEELMAAIKEDGKDKKYDCVVGLSGGIDSSLLVYQAVKRFGLRVLAVSLMNGAETPEAKHNIQRLTRYLKLDYEPLEIDINAFRRIQLAYYKAGVMGLEIPIDHGIVMYYRQKAAKHGIKHALSGHNWSTESHLPESWTYDAYDLVNIEDICHRNGASRSDLMKLPTMSRSKLAYLNMKLGIKEVRLLNFDNYNKEAAIRMLRDKIGWQPYGLKHWENIHTRFFQTYILPTRWGIDKRRSHFSALIASGQMERSKALELLRQPTCTPEMLAQDRQFILKWLNITEDAFNGYMALPTVPHSKYKTEKTAGRSLLRFLKPLVKRFR